MSASKGENYEVTIYEKHILPLLDTIEAIVECKQSETLMTRITVTEGTSRDWRDCFISSFKYDILQDDPFISFFKYDILRRQIPRFYYNDDLKTLYYRSFEGVLWRCLSEEVATNAVAEMHDGMCRAHQPELKLYVRIHQQGYYWPTMVRDSNDYTKR